MANRQFSLTGIVSVATRHVYVPVTVLPNGSSAPTIGEGDPNQSYFTITRNSAGNMTLKTVNAFPAVVIADAGVSTGGIVRLGVPVQNADGTWSIGVYTSLALNTVALGAGTVTGAGSAYTSAPSITYNNAHGNTGLKGTVTIAAGAVTAITITESGLGTDGTAPTLTLTGGGGSGATATVALNTSSAVADLPLGAQIWLDVRLRNSVVKP